MWYVTVFHTEKAEDMCVCEGNMPRDNGWGVFRIKHMKV
jgi:hypothetical protein